MKSLFLTRSCFVFLPLILATAFSGLCAETRLIPVAYKACGPDKSSPWSAEHLWDGIEDMDHKWCCFHAGYVVPQTHWIIMDLGNVFPISRIVVVHDGNEEELTHILTEDMKFFGGNTSTKGPWKLIREINDNNRQRNEVILNNVSVRYLGMEISDPQYGEGPNKKQDDWAVRIQELYIFTPQTKPAPSSPFPISKTSPFNVPPKTSPKPNPFQAPNVGGHQYASRSRVNPLTPRPSSPSNSQVGPPGLGSSAPSRNPFTLPRTNPVKSSPVSAPKQKNTVYFFYKPLVTRCEKLEQLFLSPGVQQALQGYKFEKISVAGKEAHWTRQGVFMVPTLVKMDPQGNILKKSSSIFSEQDLLEFLK